MLWKSSDGFILLNVIVFDLVSNSACKCETTLCACICMVAHTTTLILLSAGWLMVNAKNRYLCHEVDANRFCGQTVAEFNPVTSECSVSFWYFEVDFLISEKYIGILRLLLHMNKFNLLLCLSSLIFYLLQFLVTTNIYVWLCIHIATLIQIYF